MAGHIHLLVSYYLNKFTTNTRRQIMTIGHNVHTKFVTCSSSTSNTISLKTRHHNVLSNYRFDLILAMHVYNDLSDLHTKG